MNTQAKKKELKLSCERLINQEKQELEIKIKEEIQKQITQDIEEYMRKARIHISEKMWKIRKRIL